MTRFGLLLLAQVLLLGVGLLFPIVFARLNGAAAFGDVSLAASISALIVSLLVAGLGQSILRYGVSLRRLTGYALALCAVAAVAWGLHGLVGGGGRGPAFWGSIGYILAAQSALYLVYYYALRRALRVLYTLVLPGETLVRLLAVWALHALGLSDLRWLAGAFVISNLTLCLIVLAVLHGLFGGLRDPEAEAPLPTRPAWRMMRWASAGVFVDNFDRAIYAAMLPAAPRASFLFFDSLFFAGFSILANAVTLEVLATRTRGLFQSTRGLVILIVLSVAGAAAGAVGLFAFAPQVMAITGFDPATTVFGIFYALAFRAVVHAQFCAFAFIERSGLLERHIAPRLIGSIAAGAVIAVSPFMGSMVAAVVSVVIGAVVAAAALRLALMSQPTQT